MKTPHAPSAATVPSALHPARSLIHPLWLGALALLIVNDHLLKGAGVLPPVLTGKLSDFAGLVMAPALLATLLFVRTRAALLAVHLAIGSVFAAIKLSPAAAGGFEALMALGPWPWHITVDASDLVALPALAASWRLCLATAGQPLARAPRAVVSPPAAVPRLTRLTRPFIGLAWGVGLFASLATSPPPQDEIFPSLHADLVLGAASDDLLILRVRPLRDTVHLDCGAALRNPSAALSRELFDDAVAWRIEAGRVVQAQGDGVTAPIGECFAALVDGTAHRDGNTAGAGVPVPMVLLFWTAEQFPPVFIPSTTDALATERLVLVTVGADGARWQPHSAIFPAPPEAEPTPIPGCEPAPEGGFIDWQTPVPVGTRTLEAIASGPDGCHRLTFAGTGGWYVCTGGASLPFTPGDRVNLSVASVGQRFREIEGVLLIGDDETSRKRLSLARGGDLPTWGDGSWTTRDLPECKGSRGPCGSLVMPQELGIDGPDGIVHVTAGDFVTLATGTLLVHRAERIPIGDSACLPASSDDLVLESVYVEPRIIEE